MTADLGDPVHENAEKMAEEAGIQTPLYTATGWGNAAVIGEEAIPVTAAYTYPFWAKPGMSPFLHVQGYSEESRLCTGAL